MTENDIEQKLLMMRPYQIYAVRAIVDCIHQNRGNGYIWHTTGSGKTLASFKASTLLKDNPDIEKCLFVVDRKDLDRQTREEFNKFQEGCVEENTNTETLVKRLLSEDHANKVIVTTIQKLGIALDGKSKNQYKQRLEPLRDKRIVFIFDECHRSQFGDNHQAIKEFFPNSQLFGFTGTPIFEANATYRKIEGEEATMQTTDDIFQKHHRLIQAFSRTNRILNHTKPYGNVLDFRGQKDTVDAAIALFSGEHAERSRQIWLVDPAPAVIKKYRQAVEAIEKFITQRGLVAEPESVYNLKGDTARIEFINRFKEVQRLRTQLDQYTDLDDTQKQEIDDILPKDDLLSLRSSYLETAQRFKAQQDKTRGKDSPDSVEELDLVFLAYLLKSHKDTLLSFNQGTSIKGFTKDNIANFEPCFPSLPEQQRIADCLSSLDEWIAAEAKRLDAFKDHKKGLMQQLFPAEGETTPKLRFPEFQNGPEWEEISLGSIGKVSMCKRILKNETNAEGDIPFYKIGTFGKQPDAYIDRKIFEIYRSKYSYPRKGEILISASGTIGRLVVFDGVDAYFQDSNIVWIQNDERLVTNRFLFYCYEHIKWQTADNTTSRLYNDNLRAMKILIASLREQQHIADCLSSLDELIAAQAKKLNALKDHKKGLMQQLFPSGEEGSA